MSIKERLQRYCKEKHMTIGTFCRHAGISSSYFHQVKGDIGEGIRQKIADEYKDLNVEWLRTGEGEMLISHPIPSATMTPYPNITTGNVTGNGNAFVAGNGNAVNAPTSVLMGEVVTIEQPPFVPVNVARTPNLDVMDWVRAGNGRHASSTFNIMSILHETTFYTEVRSNAMSPALNQGEILFLKEFDKGFKFVDGYPYVIDTRTQGLLAYYLFDEGDYIEARPHNARYRSIKIPRNDIIRWYQILFHGSTWVATSLPSGNSQLQVREQTEQITSLIGQLDKAGERTDRLIDMIEKKL